MSTPAKPVSRSSRCSMITCETASRLINESYIVPPGFSKIGAAPVPQAVMSNGALAVPDCRTRSLPVKRVPRRNCTRSPGAKVAALTRARVFHAAPALVPAAASWPCAPSTK